jgi:hypothetical protein
VIGACFDVSSLVKLLGPLSGRGPRAASEADVIRLLVWFSFGACYEQDYTPLGRKSERSSRRICSQSMLQLAWNPKRTGPIMLPGFSSEKCLF